MKYDEDGVTMPQMVCSLLCTSFGQEISRIALWHMCDRLEIKLK